jgi:hypothetical protein
MKCGRKYTVVRYVKKKNVGSNTEKKMKENEGAVRNRKDISEIKVNEKTSSNLVAVKAQEHT